MNGTEEKIDGIPLRAAKEGDGGSENIRKIIHYIRRSCEDVKSPEQQRITNVLAKNIENKGLLDVNNLIKEHESAFGKSVGSLEAGFESSVYLFKGDRNKVIKITNWQAASKISNSYKLNATISDFIQNKIVAQNLLFPETSYEILGVTSDFRFVLQQPYIEPLLAVNGKSKMTDIEDDMIKRGFRKTAGKFGKFHVFWIDEENDYIVFDLRPANVLVGSDGGLFYIDPIIQPNTEKFRRVIFR